MSEVKYWVGLDGEEEIHIFKATRGKEYSCPECNGILIPAKGDIMAHHFKHKNIGECSGESQRHLFTKLMIYDILRNNFDLHGGEVKCEKYHLDLQPDVLIIWDEEHYLAIEVKYRSGATEKKRETYGKNMLEFDVSNWTDEQLANPMFVFNAVYPTIYLKLMEMDKESDLNLLQRSFERRREAINSKIQGLAIQEKELEERVSFANKELERLRNQKESIINDYEQFAYDRFIESSQKEIKQYERNKSKRDKLEINIQKLNSEYLNLQRLYRSLDYEVKRKTERRMGLVEVRTRTWFFRPSWYTGEYLISSKQKLNEGNVVTPENGKKKKVIVKSLVGKRDDFYYYKYEEKENYI